MNPLRLTCTLFYAFLMFFLTSCGGGSEEKASTDTTQADSTTAGATTPENTIITTPQNMMVVKHRVANFEKWKTSYDNHDSLRLANGVHSYVIGRGLQDSNAVIVAVKVDDMTKAKTFAKDRSLKEAMQKGGVKGTPSFSFVTMTFQDTATINSDIRSITMFKVKDWNAWQQAFEAADAKQERLDNGLTARAYGHDVDDDHKVVLVTAVMDTAKANAYWKSDMLKKRRAAGGAIGEPARFVHRIVQRY